MQHILCSNKWDGLIMVIEEIFPQKLALGDNFCNRVEEQKHLQNNIDGIRPTLIMSPRRYGKTSLGIYVIENLKVPYAHLDLFPLADTQDLQNAILSSIGEILASLESTPTKALKAVGDFFSQLSVSFQYVNAKVEVTLARHTTSTSKTILQALKNLENILIKKKKKAVLFLDEFQRLSQFEDSESIEGALRYMAQKSNYIIFIFSGSNRHLLSALFDDSKRPLYKLCDRIILDRISQDDYVVFIQKMAKVAWNKPLEIEAIEAILEITERHPYYVNVLCSRLWRKSTVFDVSNVMSTWRDYALEEKSSIFNELESLSKNQLKLLMGFARFDKTSTPMSDQFLSSVGLALSSVRQALRVLQEKDYIFQDKSKHYRILDPLIRYILSERPDYM